MGTVSNRLLRRELDRPSRFSSIKAIYGDRTWVSDLDIVNELGGHSGCVNALSWSKSGRLLASGSDDLYLNIHSYQPDSSTSPFVHTTTIDTGHRANIFSVKFMPHSNDRTLVCCAGDAEVRVFDIEYAGQADVTSVYRARAASHASRTRRDNPTNLQYKSASNTNAKIFRSHGDRAKRIVTESSPFLFLSCSEDGEVRQWDIRQPSTAYPPPMTRHFGARRLPRDSKFLQPPLISYKSFGIDLNTISCSASQPHYIALGGAHLHCFLHDRRMLGRDGYTERGMPESSGSRSTDRDEEVISQATRCVRRFAPKGQKKMRVGDNGHITSCKISDARPNQMIVSWSGDHIYSFDLAQSPDARDQAEGTQDSATADHMRKLKESKERKRKRHAEQSSLSLEATQRATPAPRRSRSSGSRIHASGQPLSHGNQVSGSQRATPASQRPRSSNSGLHVVNQSFSHESQISATQDIMSPALSSSSHEDVPTTRLLRIKRAKWVAKRLLSIRKDILSLPDEIRHWQSGDGSQNTELIVHFESVSKRANECYEKMSIIQREWRYPVDPSLIDIEIQRRLRNQRDTAIRFAQAAILIARVCAGFPQKHGDDGSVDQLLQSISNLSFHGPDDDIHDFFPLDFIKAIVLWLRGGSKALLAGFTKANFPGRSSVRYPIPADADEDGIREYLFPYLATIADAEKPIVNVDTSRFERDETRNLFATEKDAVTTFSLAVDEFRREKESKGHTNSPAQTSDMATHGLTLIQYWALRVGRGVLFNGGASITHSFVERCFGGESSADPDGPHASDSENDVSRSDGVVCVYDNGELTFERRGEVVPINQVETPHARDSFTPSRSATVEDGDPEDDNHVAVDERNESMPEPRDVDHVTVDEENDSIPELEDAEDLADIESERAWHTDDGGSGDDGSEEDSEAEEDFSNLSRAARRARVEVGVPCYGAVRSYKGHCNVRTVKDVNFFGLEDEYVVSGSDSGHVFIWDRKTSELVNILEGDGEVVNVVQGHPYEPMLAVSGIDSTVKIFSPDRRAQRDARNGINIACPRPQRTGSVHHNGHSGRRGLRTYRRPSPPSSPPPLEDMEGHPAAKSESDDASSEDEPAPTNHGLASCKRMQENYQITTRNDVDRRGGMQEAYLTTGMLARIAASLRARRGGAEGEEGDGMTIDLNDQCRVQ